MRDRPVRLPADPATSKIFQLEARPGSRGNRSVLFYSINALFSVPALKVYSNICCSLRITYVHGVTLELKPKDK